MYGAGPSRTGRLNDLLLLQVSNTGKCLLTYRKAMVRRRDCKVVSAEADGRDFVNLDSCGIFEIIFVHCSNHPHMESSGAIRGLRRRLCQR